jgi:hypothetical protein
MEIKHILAELESERARLDRAIAAIEGIGSDGASRPATSAPKKRRAGISAAGRKRLSMLMKRRWAQGKMKGRGKAKAA